MRKKSAIIFITAAALSLAACGAKDSTSSASASASSEAGESSESSEAGTSSVSSNAEESSTVTGEEVKTEYGTVVLGQYKGLESTQSTTEVTDDDIDSEISSLQSQYAEYETKEDGAESGDIVYAFFTGKNADGDVLVDSGEENADLEDDEDAADEPYAIYLGYAEYGEDFDENITGCKAGDELKFTVEYPEDDGNYPGETITYNVTIDHVETSVMPELDDSFIVDTLGYESEEDMREQIREELETQAEGSALETTKEDLMAQVMENSEVTDYDQDLYDEQYAQVKEYYESYMEMFGYDDLDTFLEDMGTSTDDLEEQALSSTYRMIIAKAIMDQEGLELSDEEYQSELETYASTYGFDDTDEFIETYGEDTIKSVIYDTVVLDFLYDNAVITEETEETETEDISVDLGETEEDQVD